MSLNNTFRNVESKSCSYVRRSSKHCEKSWQHVRVYTFTGILYRNNNFIIAIFHISDNRY